MASFSFSVPSKAPQVNVTSPSSTQLRVTWEPIDKKYLHGIHGGYCLYCDETPVQLLDNVHIQEYTIRAPRPYTKHYIQVAARTTPGCGAKSQRMLFFTMEDSKLNLIKVCPDHTISRVRFSF